MSDRLHKLEELIDTLRGPDGCPWDREQEIPDLRAYLLEEAHELADAIDRGSRPEMREELGDLLFQIVFLARLLSSPAGASELDTVIDGVHRKMVERHPHVFGGEPLEDADAVRRAWEERKAQSAGSALAGVPATLPALLRAYRVSQKAAGVGFDWPDAAAVFGKVEEELAEARAALDGEREAVEEEVGDLLLATANLARKLGFDPEAALQRANAKFERRFAAMENALPDGERLSEKAPAELDRLWRRAKSAVPEV